MYHQENHEHHIQYPTYKQICGLPLNEMIGQKTKILIAPTNIRQLERLNEPPERYFEYRNTLLHESKIMYAELI